MNSYINIGKREERNRELFFSDINNLIADGTI